MVVVEGSKDSRIHRHDHALLAVHRLRAVQEHWLTGHNGDVKCADHTARTTVERYEAAVHARGDPDRCFYGPAWRVRERLRDGVVACRELKLQHVARVGNDAVRGEGQGCAADEHGDDLALPGGGRHGGPGLAVDYVRNRAVRIVSRLWP